MNMKSKVYSTYFADLIGDCFEWLVCSYVAPSAWVTVNVLQMNLPVYRNIATVETTRYQCTTTACASL